MSLAAVYQQFLAAPNSSLLAPNATLHYITTTSTHNGPTDIIKHLSTSRNQVKKEKEEVLETIEGQSALVVQLDTTLEFLTSGGCYLPGLDDNFIADRTVHLPIMHIVNFGPDGKIASIRQSWDQGALLKQLDVIGKTGRNWPIRDSREQVKLINTSLAAAGKPRPSGSNGNDANDMIIRARGNSQNVLRDPHASLSLFAPREEQETAAAAAVVSPYAGARPQQRSITDILGDAPADTDEAGLESPSKGAPKIGAGKNFAPSRLFDADENAPLEPNSPDNSQSPAKGYRPHPKKYQHFDFADGSDPRDAEAAAAASAAAAAPAKGRPVSVKKDSSWSFEDFTTPQKPRASKIFRHQDVRHWGVDADGQETPAQAAQKPRRDAEHHFEFIDDGERVGEPRQNRPRGTTQNSMQHLYENNLYNEDGSAPTPETSRPLGNITNLSDRRKDFDPHFDLDDNPRKSDVEEVHKISDDRKKAVNMMNANWSSYDKSPVPQKENKPAKTNPTGDSGIHIAGDGMGGKKGTNRDWLFSDGAPEENAKPARNKAGPPQKSDFWDF